MYYDAFSRNVNEVIEIATSLAKRTGCRYIGSEHVLFGLINVSDGRAASLLREAGVDNDRYLHYYQKTIEREVIIGDSPTFTCNTVSLRILLVS